MFAMHRPDQWVVILFFLSISVSCIGARAGYRFDTKDAGLSGPYLGGFVSVFTTPDVEPTIELEGEKHLAFGGEVNGFRFVQGKQQVYTVGSVMMLQQADDSVTENYRASAIFGLALEFGNGVQFHMSMCGDMAIGDETLLRIGGCGRWTPGHWFGVDGSLSSPALAMLPPIIYYIVACSQTYCD